MNIQNDILDKIKSGELKKRPKIYFVLQTALVILGTIILLAVSVFSVSFIFYLLRASNLRFLLLFGRAGFLLFLFIFPWAHVLVALVLTIIIGWFLRRYSFAYRKPFLYLPVLIIAIITVLSIALHLIAFHRRFAQFSRQNGLPVFGQLYSNYDSKGSGNIAVVKTIGESTGGQWQAITQKGQRILVSKFPAAYPPVFPQDLKKGQVLVIFGSRQGDEIQARSIRIIREDRGNAPHGFWHWILGWLWR